MFKCLKLYRRTEAIFELQEGRLVSDMAEACTDFNVDELRLPFTTLLSK